jgi:two-component system, chemotaxis family, chemotaxis protein CheY
MATNILVVDDSGTMRAMIKRILAISGLDIGEVYEAANGIEALAQMHKHPISAILLDINMPVMNGIKLLSRLRDDARLAHIPVIIASTEGSEPRIQELLSAGARGFVRKPFRPEQLRDVLLPIIGAGAAAAPTASSGDELSF